MKCISLICHTNAPYIASKKMLQCVDEIQLYGKSSQHQIYVDVWLLISNSKEMTICLMCLLYDDAL
jgi:hypothetical protein